MSHTVDANVFVSASMQTDVFYSDSRAFLASLRQQAGTVYCPSLIVPEVVAAVARPTGQMAVALQGIRRVTTFPGMQLVPLTTIRAERAAELAAFYRLRGADVVTTMTPTEWLAVHPSNGS